MLTCATGLVCELAIAILRLSGRAAVPNQAGTVDTASCLEAEFPHLVALSRDPMPLLKEPLSWLVEGPPKVFDHVGSDCDHYVNKAIQVGFLRMLGDKDKIYVDGALVRGGAFAVPKDDVEDRGISPLERVSALVDRSKLPGAEYGCIPQHGTLTVREDPCW